MSTKIKLNTVAEILKKNQVHPSLLRQIVEEMNLASQPEGGEESPPAIKKQFCILISDPEGLLAKRDFAGYCDAALDVESEVLPVCSANRHLEGSIKIDATTHANAGGKVRVSTPRAALQYFKDRFALFAP